MAAFLPLWVYELIAAIDKYEDEHSKGAACFGEALGLVPAHELAHARFMNFYREKTSEETQ